MSSTKPASDIKISHDLIDSLLKEFVPDLAGLPIEFVAAGWDNEIHRVGDDHAVRLPRRKEGAPLVEHEQRWLPELAEEISIAIPAPIHAGVPAFGFPWHWSVVPWIHGVPLAHAPELSTESLIDELTTFLNELHKPAPTNAPDNPYRGVPLADLSAVIIERIGNLATLFSEIGIDVDVVLRLWAELSATEPWSGEPVWLHGDFHPMNILIFAGLLSGVLDFGDITSGDPASDLMIAWMVLDNADDRNSFRQRSAVAGRSIDIHTWDRARAWALAHSTAILENSSDDPAMRRMAIRTMKNVIGTV